MVYAHTTQLTAIHLLKLRTTANYLYVAGQVRVQGLSVILLHSPGRSLFLLLPVIIHMDITVQWVALDCGFQGDGSNVFPQRFVYYFLTDPVQV